MSDSDSDVQTSVKMTQNDDIVEAKPEKKPRKKMEVSERRRAASQANLAKAREARAKKKADKVQAEDETQTILKEMAAQEKAKRKAAKDGKDSASPQPEEPPATPVFGKQRARAVSNVQSEESEKSEESEESEKSEESDDSSSEDSDVEFVLKPAKKKAASQRKAQNSARAGSTKSSILARMEAMKAELDALKKEKKSSRVAPVNVYLNQKGSGEKRVSALDAKVNWD